MLPFLVLNVSFPPAVFVFSLMVVFVLFCNGQHKKINFQKINSGIELTPDLPDPEPSVFPLDDCLEPLEPDALLPFVVLNVNFPPAVFVFSLMVVFVLFCNGQNGESFLRLDYEIELTPDLPDPEPLVFSLDDCLEPLEPDALLPFVVLNVSFPPAVFVFSLMVVFVLFCNGQNGGSFPRLDYENELTPDLPDPEPSVLPLDDCLEPLEPDALLPFLVLNVSFPPAVFVFSLMVVFVLLYCGQNEKSFPRPDYETTLTPDSPDPEPSVLPLDDCLEPLEPDALLPFVVLNVSFPPAVFVFSLMVVFVLFCNGQNGGSFPRLDYENELTPDLPDPEPSVLPLDDCLEPLEPDALLPFLVLNVSFPPAVFVFSLMVVFVLLYCGQNEKSFPRPDYETTLTPDSPDPEPSVLPLDDCLEPLEPDALLPFVVLNVSFPPAVFVFSLMVVFVLFCNGQNGGSFPRLDYENELTPDLPDPEPSVLPLDDCLEPLEPDALLPFLVLNVSFPPAVFVFSLMVVFVLFCNGQNGGSFPRLDYENELTPDLPDPEPSVLPLDDCLEPLEPDALLPFLVLNVSFPPAVFVFSLMVVFVLLYCGQNEKSFPRPDYETTLTPDLPDPEPSVLPLDDCLEPLEPDALLPFLVLNVSFPPAVFVFSLMVVFVLLYCGQNEKSFPRPDYETTLTPDSPDPEPSVLPLDDCLEPLEPDALLPFLVLNVSFPPAVCVFSLMVVFVLFCNGPNRKINFQEVNSGIELTPDLPDPELTVPFLDEYL